MACTYGFMPPDPAHDAGSGGEEAVLKLMTPPPTWPAALVATTRKKYRAPGVSPVNSAETAWSELPEPALCWGVLLPKLAVGPYSKWYVVGWP